MEIILRKGRYALIDRGHEYVVVMGFDETQPENQQWEQGMYYTHWNESEFKKMCMLQDALNRFRTLVDMNYISRARLEELATKFKDGLLECDEDFATEFFEKECELTESEMEWLGIENNEDNEYEIGEYEEEYVPSVTRGDYSPSNPWDAPGMSIRDFI